MHIPPEQKVPQEAYLKRPGEDLEALNANFAAHGCTLGMKFSLIPSDCPNRGESMTKIQEDSNM